MSYYLPFDSQRETVAFLAGHAATQPGMAEMAKHLGCHVRVAARIAAEKMYRAGYRTTTLDDGTVMHKPPAVPIGPLDDPPPPGKEQDRAA